MHRIDAPTATVDSLFTDGTPSGGVPATVVPAAWLNDIQEELMSILVAGGVAPLKGVQDQVLEAITQLITDAAPDASTTVKGKVELATNAEMAAGSSALLVPPVSAVMSLFSKRVFSTNDFIRIPDVPGGLIIQFGHTTFAAPASTAPFDVSFPTPFPNFCRFVDAVIGISNTDYDANVLWRSARQEVSVGTPTLNGFEGQVFMDNSTSEARRAYWIAGGY